MKQDNYIQENLEEFDEKYEWNDILKVYYFRGTKRVVPFKELTLK